MTQIKAFAKGLPEFEKKDRFKMNIVNCALLAAFVLNMPKRRDVKLPGMEHCEAWNLKKRMLTLAIPEHCIMWPLIVCPLTGVICVGIGVLI